MIKGILIPAFVLNEDKEIIRRRNIKNGGKQSKYYEKYVEMQQLRQYCEWKSSHRRFVLPANRNANL